MYPNPNVNNQNLKIQEKLEMILTFLANMELIHAFIFSKYFMLLRVTMDPILSGMSICSMAL